MQNLTYLAVFEPSTNGSYSIYFPNLPGCIRVGNNLEEAAHMAVETASLHVYSMECDKEEIPVPFVNLSKEKRIAEEQKVNYSRILEIALMDYLQIPRFSKQ